MGHHASHCCSTPQCMAVAFVSKVEAHRSECLLRSHCLLELLPKSLVFTVKMCKSASNYCRCLSHTRCCLHHCIRNETNCLTICTPDTPPSISFKCLNETNENKINLFISVSLFFQLESASLLPACSADPNRKKEKQEKSMSGSTGRHGYRR